jgi:hypothetical protein
MTNQIQIARLEQVDIRSAWQHEALNFTPWLYQNLDALGEAIGLSLEPEGSEVEVLGFSADILARNKFDGTNVLIENQLECSDHTHLGQIMTYLAGLDAKTIIWIAADFREAHLSAINWLNENTDESFSFFAVQVKVVRIGDSPLAPIFDVVARPNNWERRLNHVNPSRETRATLSERRYKFWQAFLERVPSELKRSGPANYRSNRWRIIDKPPAIISMYTATDSVGIFLRAPQNGSHEEMRELLASKAEIISERLGIPMGNSDRYFFVDSIKGIYSDPAQQNKLIDWLAQKADLYENVIREVFENDFNDSQQ